MPSTEKEYHIAWILSSPDQYEAARDQFDDPFDFRSPDEHIVYTLGRVNYHDVVMASPASRSDIPTVEIIINDLLQQYPSIRAGFVVSTDAYTPRKTLARVGDVVIGANSRDMSDCVTYVDAEKTNQGERLSMTGLSGNVPVAVAKAIKKLGSHQSVPTSRDRKPQVHHGAIVSSAQQIKDSIVEDTLLNEEKFLCFETAASTMKTRPLTLLAGVTNYCGEDRDAAVRDQTCKAVISYLTRLIQHIDHHELEDEPAIEEYFEYETLDLEKPACRLFRIDDGTGELQCHIFQTYLPSDKKTLDDKIHDETVLIPYDALSYCWGSNELTKSIRVNGKILLVTSNLFQALMDLRRTRRCCAIWIDAICIDQRNLLERGHQVGMMGKLYSQADEVLIWLGDIGDDTDELFSMLKAFEANVSPEARRKWTSEDNRYQLLWLQTQFLSPDKPRSLQSKLEALMDNPWFSRVWIVQEVANAKKASLGCTNGWVDARTFAVVPKLLQVVPNIRCQAIIDIMPGVSRKFSWFGEDPNLSTLLWKFRESQASKPLDKVYALLGISSDKPIAADYTKTEQNVVEELMKYFLQDDSNRLDLQDAKVSAFQRLLSKGLERQILKGTGLDYLERLRARYSAPLLLESETVHYLRYVRSPLLEQLVHQGSLVLSEESTAATPLATFSVAGKIQVTTEILETSRQNDMGFISMVLDLERDDIAIGRALVIEAISSGPSVLKRFLDRYNNKARNSEDFDGKEMLLAFQGLKDSFEHAGVFPKHSDDTLRRLLYERSNEISHHMIDRHRLSRHMRENNETITEAEVQSIISLHMRGFGITITEAELQNMNHSHVMEVVETITEAEFQHMDATFKDVLQQTYDRSKVTDEVSVRAIRGGQDGIRTFLDPYVSEFDKTMADLLSKYSVEVFYSSRANDVEIMHVEMWPGSVGKEQRHEVRDGLHKLRYETRAWKVLVPNRFIDHS